MSVMTRSYVYAAKGENVFEIGITLPGRADVSLAVATAYRLVLVN